MSTQLPNALIMVMKSEMLAGLMTTRSGPHQAVGLGVEAAVEGIVDGSVVHGGGAELHIHGVVSPMRLRRHAGNGNHQHQRAHDDDDQPPYPAEHGRPNRRIDSAHGT